MIKNILFTHRVRKYQGRYIAVAGDKVIVSGRSAKETFQLAKEILGRKRVEGIYYVPRRKDLLTALCVFRISN